MKYKDYWGCPVCGSDNIQRRNQCFHCCDCYTDFHELLKYMRPFFGRDETHYYIQMIESGRESEALLSYIERKKCSNEYAKMYINQIKIEYGLIPSEIRTKSIG